MDKKISIIVPVYNVEEYLNKCIESIIKQTYKNIEIILINDGSKDKSLDICREYEKIDKRIRVLNIENNGVSNARNRGIELSTGDFIMFCDSDDWVEAEWCEELINSFDVKKMSMCALAYNYEDEYIKVDNNLCLDSNIISINKEDFIYLYDYGFNSPCNKIYSKKIIEENNIRFNRDISLGEDALFNLEYLGFIDGGINYINTCLYNYRQSSSVSLTSKYLHDGFEQCIYVYDEIYNYMIKYGNKNVELEKYFYTIYFNQLSNILYMNCSSYSNLSFWNKLRKNKEIMKSIQYRTCLKKKEEKKMKFYDYLFKFKTYLPIYVYTQLYKLIKEK